MRAVVLEKFGGAENLADATLPMLKVGVDDVLIRVKAVGFNPTDYQLRQSGHPSLTPPVVLGRDVAGVVEACGSNVRDLKPGDTVFSNLVPRSLGGYAEFVAAPSWYVAPMPASLSFAEAASVPVAAMTALCAAPGAAGCAQVSAGGGRRRRCRLLGNRLRQGVRHHTHRRHGGQRRQPNLYPGRARRR